MDATVGSTLWMRYLREEPVATIVASGLVLWSLYLQLSADRLALSLVFAGLATIFLARRLGHLKGALHVGMVTAGLSSLLHVLFGTRR